MVHRWCQDVSLCVTCLNNEDVVQRSFSPVHQRTNAKNWCPNPLSVLQPILAWNKLWAAALSFRMWNIRVGLGLPHERQHRNSVELRI